MAKIECFGSVEEMFKTIEADRKAADVQVKPWQAELKEGDCFVRVEPSMGIAIYGEILDPVPPDDNESEEAKAEREYTKKLYASPHMAHFRFSRCYSEVVPEGEYGDVHVAVIDMKLTREQFEEARAKGWPFVRPQPDSRGTFGAGRGPSVKPSK